TLKFIKKFVAKDLSQTLGLGPYNIQTPYDVDGTELSLFSWLQSGSFILTTAPLYALARANNYQIYLTPKDIERLINVYLEGEQRKKTIREFYANGLHNQLIINRRPQHPEDDAVVMKLARISLSTSEHIARHPKRFTQFIADQWKNDKKMSKYHIDVDSILEAMDVSYRFQTMENYLSTYFEQGLQRYDGDLLAMRSIFEQVMRERTDVGEVEESIRQLLEDHSGGLTAKAKQEFEEQQIISDFCLKSGAYELARKAQTRKKELLLSSNTK
ncbi:MAG TPA: hypothetical protein VN824_02075, partial [Puia sp.]|nr:hypothetical protein [Puia sp.]